jgi:hypothetical protein
MSPESEIIGEDLRAVRSLSSVLHPTADREHSRLGLRVECERGGQADVLG